MTHAARAPDRCASRAPWRATRALVPALVLVLALAVLALSACRPAPAPATSPAPGAEPAATVTAAPSTSGPPATSTAPPAATAEAVASTAMIPTAELPVVEFVRSDGSRVALPVEVIRRSEYSIGLSGRSHLSGRGMLFYFTPDETNPGFWMQDTHIDLAIAFVGADGRVLELHELQAESLDVVRPDEHFQYAVEAPAGWYAAHRVHPGDTLELRFDLPADILE